MGTRSRIAAKNADGAFTSIYCHWDGYPSGVGATLAEHYKDEAKVRALLALGDISSLGDEIGEQHGFDDRSHPNWTTAYGRDRGETDIQGEVSNGIDALNKLTRECGGEYLYVFADGAWLGAEGGIAFFGGPASKEPGTLKPIEQLIAEAEQE